MTQESDVQAAKEAHDRIEQAKEKIFGVSQAKAALQNTQAAALREQIAKLKSDCYSLKKLPETEMLQQALALVY